MPNPAKTILDEVASYLGRTTIAVAALAIDHFRIRPFTDQDGTRLLLFQRRIEGKRYVTVAAIDASGNIWIAGSFMATTDFDVKKWNPS